MDKINKDDEGNFLTSAWFLSKYTTDNLAIANSVLKFQYNFVKKNYKNLIWIITMKKQNKFVQKLNKKFGFYQATKNSVSRLAIPVSKKNNKIEVMEMKL